MRRALLGLGLLCLVSASARAAEKALPGERVFGTAKVVPMHLTMDAKQFAAMTPAGGAGMGFGGPGRGPGFGPARPPAEGTHRNTFGIDFPWSRGEITFDGIAHKDAGIRYKGNYTILEVPFQKPLVHLLGQRVHADEFLVVLTRNGEGEFHERGARRRHARVSKDGKGKRLACLGRVADSAMQIQHGQTVELLRCDMFVDIDFQRALERTGRGHVGMLLKPEGAQGGLTYQGSTWSAYERRYKPDDAPTEEQKKRLIDFTKLISQAADEEFAKDISSYLDIEAFLKFIAANALMANMDSYLGYGHNYYLYLVPGSKKFVFIPWDLDLSLATWPAVGTPEQLVELSIHHPHAGQNKLIDRLFAIREHKDRYIAIIKDLMATTFTRKKLLADLEQIEKALQEPMARETKAVAGRKEGRSGGGFGPGRPGMGFGGGQFGASMPPRRFIDKRIASVEAQLEGKSKGFEPKAFGMGFGGPRPGGP